jgi:hypothetical protein
MGWDKQRGRLYYSRTRRVNGRFVRQYFGRGPEAYQAAAEDARRRWERQQRALARDYLQNLDQEVINFTRLVNGALEAVLLGHGWVRRGGEWRHRTHEHCTEDEN